MRRFKLHACSWQLGQQHARAGKRNRSLLSTGGLAVPALRSPVSLRSRDLQSTHHGRYFPGVPMSPDPSVPVFGIAELLSAKPELAAVSSTVVRGLGT
jgi:hypothetical protein